MRKNTDLIPVKNCVICGALLEKKMIWDSKRQREYLENPFHFNRRTTCGGKCKIALQAKNRTREIVVASRSHTRARAIALKGACAECGGAGTRLEVHHKDFDELNNEPSNLICLCTKCHHAKHPQKKGHPPCKICGKPSQAHQLCFNHYYKLRRYGNPLGFSRKTKNVTDYSAAQLEAA